MNYSAEIIKLDLLTTFPPALNPSDIHARHLKSSDRATLSCKTLHEAAAPQSHLRGPALFTATQVSPSLSLLAGCCQICCSPAAPFPRFPLSDLAAIMEPSNVNLPLIYHISSSDIQIRFPLSIRIVVIPLYGLDSSFLVLCLWLLFIIIFLSGS